MVNDRDCQRRLVGHTRFKRIGTDCPESLDGGTELFVDMGRRRVRGVTVDPLLLNYLVQCCATITPSSATLAMQRLTATYII
jgi:hypothetical protein